MTISNIMLERHRLIRVFNECKDYRIIAVCAPAGYGKTVAVTQWLDKDTRAKAILSIDEYDNNLAIFCERFCAALITCQHQNQTVEEIVSHPSFQGAPDVFALRAISALFSRKQAALVIDDLHLIHDDAILQLLFVFIKRLPKNFQIILISRNDLPISFSELWIKGYAAKINAEQFLFSNDEVKALYNKRGNPVTQKQADDINLQANGWAIGINAFMLSGRESFNNAVDYMDDFVRANIWDKWDDITRDFILHTAFLRELTPSACDAMTGVNHSDKFLKALVQKGAFIVQLQDGTYRYHHLFQKFIKHIAEERGEVFLHSLLETEGHWHLSQKDFYSAIDCFIRCKNHEGIAKCYGLLEVSGRENFSLSKLLPIVKNQEFQNTAKEYPFMLFVMICCSFADGRADDMASLMDNYYNRHSDIAIKYPNSAHKILHVRAYDFRLSIEKLHNELEAMSTTLTLSNTLDWTVSMHMPLLYRGIRDYSELAVEDVVKRCTTEYSRVSWILGEEALMHHETIVSGLLYEQGQLEKAYEHAVMAIGEVRSHFLTEANFCAMSIMVYVLDAMNKNVSEAASDIMQSISQMIEETKSYHLSHNFDAIAVRRAISSGNIRVVEKWLNNQTFGDPTLYEIYADLTTGRAYIATEKYDAAIILLKRVLEIAKSFNRPLDIIEAQILLSIACWKNKGKFKNEALDYLESAVRAALPYNYVQMFVNDGSELSGILYKLQRRVEQRKGDGRKHIEFIKMLYALTRSKTIAEPIKESTEKSLKFTNKQKEVMALLIQGKHQREIADILGIKFTTLRSRLALIYNKLGVTNVTDAIVNIKAMRLFE